MVHGPHIIEIDTIIREETDGEEATIGGEEAGLGRSSGFHLLVKIGKLVPQFPLFIQTCIDKVGVRWRIKHENICLFFIWGGRCIGTSVIREISPLTPGGPEGQQKYEDEAIMYWHGLDLNWDSILIPEYVDVY